ncbi:MAG: hypothetical protein ABSF93_15655, partial [Candidatus Sulfotelmatobacter sp.]
MNRVSSFARWAMGAVLFLSFGVNRTLAQAAQPANPPAAPQQDQAQKPATSPSANDAQKSDAPKKDAEGPRNPFAPEPAPPLPPGMSGSDPNDPRAKLTPGMYDAGEAAMGIQHLLLLKKPEAFDLGSSDADAPKVKNALGQMGVPEAMMSKMPKSFQLVIAQLAFANSDLAFQGNHLFQGNFYGINIFDISNPAKASLLTSMVCPGGQGDVSVYKNLLFMSVEMPNGRLDCGAQGFPPEPMVVAEPKDDAQKKPDADKDKDSDQAKSADADKDKDKPKEDKPKERRGHLPAAQKDRFRGVRIFDISNIQNPKQVAAIQTCRGSHTHTLVVDPNDKDNVYIYVSGTSFVRQSEELEGCSGEKPDKDPNTALFRIDVIKVPVAAPQDAKIVSSPRVFMDARTGALNGLNNGGTHGKQGSEKPADTDQCHDITAYSAIGLAAGACSGNGILLDIKDPVNP